MEQAPAGATRADVAPQHGLKVAPWQCSIPVHCATSGRTWRWPWAARRSQGEASPLGAQPLIALGARASRLQSRRFHRRWDHPGSGTTTTASTTRGRRLPSRSSRISTGRRSNWRGRDRGCERTFSGRHHVCVVTTRAVTARIDAHFFLGSELFREHLLFLPVHALLR